MTVVMAMGTGFLIQLDTLKCLRVKLSIGMHLIHTSIVLRDCIGIPIKIISLFTHCIEVRTNLRVVWLLIIWRNLLVLVLVVLLELVLLVLMLVAQFMLVMV